MTKEESIEKAAQALFSVRTMHIGRQTLVWDEASDNVKRNMRAQARVALEASGWSYVPEGSEVVEKPKNRFTGLGLCSQGWSFFESNGIRSYHCRCSVCEGYFMAPDRMTICQSCAMIQAGEKP